jgi:SAM-dependent methyltransferase
MSAPARGLIARARQARAKLGRRDRRGRLGEAEAGRSADGHQAGEARLPGTRGALTERYLRGSGIEIGALHQPLQLPPGTEVRYVDRMTVEELRSHYPELSGFEFVAPDIVDDGEQLRSFASESLDFVIANHFLEHTEDPIATLGNHLRVLKPDGILFLALPDKRATFDRDRPVTDLEHLIRDHQEGPEWSRRLHFEEWARLVDKVEDPSGHAERLLDSGYSIHFHVWTPSSFLGFLSYCGEELSLPFELEAFQRDTHEFVAVLRKLPAD